MSENPQPQTPETDAPELDEQDLDSVAGGRSIRLPEDTIMPISPLPEPCFPTYPIDTF